MNQKNSKYVIVYSTPDGDVRVNAIVKDETIWLTQKGIAELFDIGVPAVSNIYYELQNTPKGIYHIPSNVKFG